MSELSYLIKNARFVVTMDPSLGVLENCDVLLQGDTIAKIGHNIEGPAGVQVIDAENAIVSPGFIDTHRHVWQTQIRSVANDWTLFDYFVHVRNRFASCYTKEDAYLGNYVGALEAIFSGVTSLVDHSHIINTPAHADAVIKGLQDAGIRATWCYGFWPNPDYTKSDPFSSRPDWRTEDIVRVKEQFFTDNDEDLIRFGLAPTEIAATPVPLFLEEVQLGRKLNAKLITAHVAKGFYDHNEFHVTKINNAGMLGPDLLLSHGSAFTDDELRMIRENKVKVSSTPETELQMGMGHPVCFRSHDAGCLSSLGIDIVSNNSGDMFNQMRLALQSERSVRNAETAARGKVPVKIARKTEDVLRLATIGGAECMGLEHLTGTLTVGKKADLIITSCEDINMVPIHDPILALVQHANSHNVSSVFVNGKLLKHNGRLVGVDWEAVKRELRQSAENIMARAAKIDKEPLIARARKLGYHEDARAD
ncbi:Metal-dependent hydrolase, composite domain protein [Niveomyces insectorum RCEF 264]|uniref:Metal-dependent hydrolase, composite domain protein n=1 Tax=Niveomyces insectorum RCEF 264 TaxID=1081102 RepID=A0A162JCI1_9HYPO|nr:Metal-dependent hydrolase, composite domain protein [Niveomyces insectorum RCEF 264]